MRAVESVDLVSEKSEGESDHEVGTSSSDSSSQEEFQEEQKKRKLYYPPEPPEGYVFWQHSRLKTLHLAPPDFKRVFLCATGWLGPYIQRAICQSGMTHRSADCVWAPPNPKAKLALIEDSMQREPRGK